MDSDQDLLDAHDAREAVRAADEWKRKRANHQRHENAAREAHKVRNRGRLICFDNADVRDWENIPVVSQNHLIADAENVAANPSITVAELSRLHNERLIAWGDIDSPDLGVGDENAPSYQEIEEMVLKRLKECLVDPIAASISVS
jgi:hypothetical protein